MAKRQIALLSNITADMIAAKLKKEYDVYLPDGYDMWISDILNPASGQVPHRHISSNPSVCS